MLFNTLCEGLKKDIKAFYHNYSPYTPDEEIDYTYYNMVQIRRDLEDSELIAEMDKILNYFKELEAQNYIILPKV